MTGKLYFDCRICFKIILCAEFETPGKWRSEFIKKKDFVAILKWTAAP